MKKSYYFCLVFLCSFFSARADHITGGEMFYTLAGTSNGQYQYAVTLKLYMRCNSGRQFNNPATVSIFDRVTGQRVQDLTITLTSQQQISLAANSNPCIFNPPTVCYEVGYYNFTVSLPASANGYVLSSQVNYRIAGINNLSQGYGLIGALYTAEIPGTAAVNNNSAQFIGSDLVILCENNPMSYSFAAEDADGDQLRYSFCTAYQSTTGSNAGPTGSPPFPPVPYGSGFSESAPLGGAVQVNSSTGLITGTAPASGVYVVTVCVQEIRNGTVIAMQRKDLQVFIAPCNLVAAMLEPDYMLCGNTQTIFLSNGISNPLIQSYNWSISSQSGSQLYSSSSQTLTYTFADTGTYKVRLAINSNQQCSDSVSSIIRVYPGFVPDFTVNGICVSKPSRFFDASTSVYGTVNSWNWDFGDLSTPADISNLQNPVYTYAGMGTRSAQLIVTNTKGCRDTVVKTINIIDKPPIALAFRDTLICVNDALQLQASGGGQFSWTPLVNITNANTANPTVSPTTTTTYTVRLDDNGCLNTDSVRVRVTDHVTLQAMNDTLICSGDTIQLRLVSDGLRYAWSPAAQFMDATVPNPVSITPATTSYQVTAIIGGCSATDQVVVTTVPYPAVFAGLDTTICYGTQALLNGSSNGNSFYWSPGGGTALNYFVRPASTTTYILSAIGNNGCPKPASDTVVVNVKPPIRAFAGNDTAVVSGQPLQLRATGGTSYQWSPALYLSAANIPDPVATFDFESFQVRYKVLVLEDACVDSAFITVRIFKTPPTVFVPSAFTPNGDGLNDLLRPIAAGMQQIEQFSIYNRWGDRVFYTTVSGRGWDGKINGREQGTGTFIWMVKALDYQGKPYFQKGTTTLIR